MEHDAPELSATALQVISQGNDSGFMLGRDAVI